MMSKDYTVTKDITLDFVPTMSHWLLAKLLSFTTELGPNFRVIVPTLKIGQTTLTMEPSRMN